MDVCFLEAVPGTGFPGAPCLASHHCRACFAGGKAPAGSPVSDAAGCAGYVPAEAQWTSIGLPCRLPCPDRFRCMSGHGCLAGVLHLDPVRHASLGHALSGHTPPDLHRQHRRSASLAVCRLIWCPLRGAMGKVIATVLPNPLSTGCAGTRWPLTGCSGLHQAPQRRRTRLTPCLAQRGGLPSGQTRRASDQCCRRDRQGFPQRKQAGGGGGTVALAVSW